MLPIQAKPVSRSAQFEVAKVAPQVGASQVPCGLCCYACSLVPNPIAQWWCKFGCDQIPGCTCP
jgi:hypothetical protein